jgi:hypothetical protein
MVDAYATVVTAFYKIPSKHKPEDYFKYARNLLSNCPAHIVLFTSKDLSQTFREMRGNLPLTVFEEDMQSPVSTWASKFIWKVAARKNNIRQPHSNNSISPELLQIWLSKAWFVEQAIARLNLSQTHVMMWCDIGCVRSNDDIKSLRNWPLLSKLDVSDNKLRFFKRRPIPKKYTCNIDYDPIIAGSNIFGNVQAWKPVVEDIRNAVFDNIKLYKDALNDETIYLKLVMIMPEKVYGSW